MSETRTDLVAPASAWKRSTFCGETSCVEIAITGDGIGVRDSKLATSPVLSFTRSEWDAFVLGVKNGEFDLSS